MPLSYNHWRLHLHVAIATGTELAMHSSAEYLYMCIAIYSYKEFTYLKVFKNLVEY